MGKPRDLDRYIPASQAAKGLRDLAGELQGSPMLVKWNIQVWLYNGKSNAMSYTAHTDANPEREV